MGLMAKLGVVSSAEEERREYAIYTVFKDCALPIVCFVEATPLDVIQRVTGPGRWRGRIYHLIVGLFSGSRRTQSAQGDKTNFVGTLTKGFVRVTGSYV